MTSSEEISRANSSQNGKTDSNLANDTLHVGGIPADDMATKSYVQQYHDTKEQALKEYIDSQDASKLETAKAYTDQAIANQDFSNFAEISDLQALNDNITDKINNEAAAQKQYTDQKIQDVVNDVNDNFNDVGQSLDALNQKTNELFTSVSNGKSQVAGAITDKGVPTSANDSFSTMASNIRQIEGGGGVIPPGYVDTSDATATADKIASGYTAYARGSKITGTLGQGGNATPYDIKLGKSAYVNNQLIQGLLTIDESTGQPSYSVGDVEKVYGTAPIKATISKLNSSDETDINKILLVNSNLNTIEGSIKSYYADEIKISASAENSNVETFNLKTFLQNKGLFTSNTTFLFDPLAASSNFKLGQQGGYVLGRLKVDSLVACWIIVLTLKVKDTQSGGGHIYSWEVDEDNVYAIKANEFYTNAYITGASFPITRDFNYFICTTEKDLATWKLSTGTWSSGDTNGLEGLKKIEIISRAYVGTNNYQSQFNRYPVFSYRNDNKILFVTNSCGYNYSDNHGTSYWETYTTVLMLSAEFSILAYNFYSRKMTPSGNGLQAIDNNGNIYSMGYNWDSYAITCTLERTLTTNPHINNNELAGTAGNSVFFRILNKDATLMYQYEVWYTMVNNTYKLHYACYIYTVDFSSDDFATFLQEFGTKYDAATSTSYISRSDGVPTMVQFGSDENIFLFAPQNYSLNKKSFLSQPILDYSVVVALKYNGEYYYPTKGRVLTAGQGDVKAGKTFIGWQGYPETGTMEV